MKHTIVYGQFNESYPKGAEPRVKEIIIENIAQELLKNESVEFEELNQSNLSMDSGLRGSVTVIKTSDFNNMMKYISMMGDYVFYDKENEKEIRLLDLI